MKNKTKLYLFLSLALLFAFILFTVAVTLVDVMPIGPLGSSVGLATLNAAVHDGIGTSSLCYDIAEICGMLCMIYPLFFAGVGLFQLVKRKSLFKVDHSILLLGVFYIIVIAAYFIFEIAKINYRPVFMDGELEASYPSSHTILAICFTLSALLPLGRLLGKRRKLYGLLCVLSLALLIATVVTRFLSGVHWFTDIVGGVLLSSALTLLYFGSVFYTQDKLDLQKL